MSKKYGIICVCNLGKEFIMKKTLLGMALILGASAANASGLYIGAGYGKKAPSFSLLGEQISGSSTIAQANPYILAVPGFPNGSVLAYNDGQGYQAGDWDSAVSDDIFDTDNTNIMSVSVGWDIPQNPFRFELEYQRSKFSIRSWSWTVTPTDGDGAYVYPAIASTTPSGSYQYCPVGSSVCFMGSNVNDVNNYAIDVPNYTFQLPLNEPIDVDFSAYMANVFFEIPGLGSVDPYIGFGYGKAKVDGSYLDIDGELFKIGTDSSTAKQLIAGIEYRFEESPVVAGVEFRKFKTSYYDKYNEADAELKYDYIMFKLRYDFISDEF